MHTHLRISSTWEFNGRHMTNVKSSSMLGLFEQAATCQYIFISPKICCKGYLQHNQYQWDTSLPYAQLLFSWNLGLSFENAVAHKKKKKISWEVIHQRFDIGEIPDKCWVALAQYQAGNQSAGKHFIISTRVVHLLFNLLMFIYQMITLAPRTNSHSLNPSCALGFVSRFEFIALVRSLIAWLHALCKQYILSCKSESRWCTIQDW